MPPLALDLIAAGLFGALVGVGELVARYRDAPTRALSTLPAFIYIFVNAAASAFALWLAQSFDWTFDQQAGTEQARIIQVLIAGFGSMAFFRSSLFMVRVGDDDIGVGPIAFLQVILAACDRGVDRIRAVGRALDVSRAMEGLRFADVEQSLPTYALMLTQNVPPEEQASLGDQVKRLSTSNMSDQLKVLGLGLLVMNYVGSNVLNAAVDAVRREIRQARSGRRGLGEWLGRDGGDQRDTTGDRSLRPETGAEPPIDLPHPANSKTEASDNLGSGPPPGAAPPGTAIGATMDEPRPAVEPEPPLDAQRQASDGGEPTREPELGPARRRRR